MRRPRAAILRNVSTTEHEDIPSPIPCAMRTRVPHTVLGCGCQTPEPVYYCLSDATTFTNTIGRKRERKPGQEKRAENYNICLSCEHRVEPTPYDNFDLPEMQPPSVADISPLAKIKIDGLCEAKNLLNCSAVEYRGKVLMAYRHGWHRASVYMAELDAETMQPIWQTPLAMPEHSQHRLAQEDPRLFVFGGQLHVAYSGVSRDGFGSMKVSVMVARLNDRYLADKVYAPHFGHRRHWEKNWGFFERAGDLHAVYDIAPHRILKIDLNKQYASQSAETPFDVPAELGVLRGGASPVFVPSKGEWYSWCHSSWWRNKRKWYALSLYTFEDSEPFTVKRHVGLPILLPDTKDMPGSTVPHCVYPCGAYLRDGVWTITYGYYDHECWAVRYDAREIEGLLS